MRPRIIDPPPRNGHAARNGRGDVPPHDWLAEEAALFAALAYPELRAIVLDRLDASDYHRIAHAEIHRTLAELTAADPDSVDYVRLWDALRGSDHADDVGDLLVRFADRDAWPVLPTSIMTEEHCRIVAELARRRRLAAACRDLARLAADPTADAADLDQALDTARKFVSGPLESKGSGNEFCPVPFSALGGGEPVAWLWEGWLARGYITLLAGLWKAGKSTLLGHLLRAAGTGGDIAGRIAPSRWLIVTEEGSGLWQRRRDDLAIGDHAAAIIRPWKGKPSSAEWLRMVREVAGHVQTGPYDVVVLDTWPNLNPSLDENDTPATIAALAPLHHITEAGAGLLLVHHLRKGDGTEGQGSRGSGALTGFVDVILEFRRYDGSRQDDTRRTLRGLSRFEETPKEVVIELRDDGYRSLGATSEARQQDRTETIAAILSEADWQLTAEEIRDRWPEDRPPGERLMRRYLEEGHAAGHWPRSGRGRKGDPYRYGDHPAPALFDAAEDDE